MVTLTTDDLIQPAGYLDATYFPDENGPAYIAGWLAQATTLVEANPGVVDDDVAAEAYVYARAFQFFAVRYNVLATTTTIAGEITRTINKEQVQFYLTEAERWQSLYDFYAGGGLPGEEPGTSVATAIFEVW